MYVRGNGASGRAAVKVSGTRQATRCGYRARGAAVTGGLIRASYLEWYTDRGRLCRSPSQTIWRSGAYRVLPTAGLRASHSGT